MIIVYCINSIFHIGGIEAVTVFKANALAQTASNSVWIVHTEYNDSRPFYLSPKVHLVDLGIRYYENVRIFPRNLIRLGINKRLHRRKMKRILYQICPDVVISTGNLEFSFLSKIRGPWKTIREVHTTKHHKRLSARTPKERILAAFAEWRDYGWVIKQYDHIVILTQEDKEHNWSNSKNISVIPNPCRFRPGGSSPLTAKRILAVGRLSYEKNFSSLIRAFALVHSHHPDWTLCILGDGEERPLLQEEISRLKLDGSVSLNGMSTSVQKEMLTSSMLVSTSLYEGFSMVLVEALSCGLPVISYDYPCGPKDIIKEGKTGFLVPRGNEEVLATRISILIENDTLRREMGALAQQESQKYDIGRITSLWMDLFYQLIQSK